MSKDEDNWKYRSYNMKCGSCMWYVRKENNKGSDVVSVDFGRCRRHAPIMSGFPAVFGADWCGDHKLDENAIG